MKPVMNDCEMDTLFSAWSEDRQSATPAPLTEWIARYPDSAEELTRWSADAPVMDYAESLPDDAHADARSLAIGKQVLQELRSRMTSPIARPLVSLKESAQNTGINLRTLASRLGLGLPLIMKLEYRHLQVASLPMSLIQQVAEILQVSSDQVRAYLTQSPTLAPGASYKSDNVPQVSNQEEFAQAVHACSDMNEDQKARWIAAE